MTSYRQKIELLRKEENDLRGQIKNLENQLNNKSISDAKAQIKKDQIAKKNERLREIPGEIKNLANELPPVTSKENTRTNRILKRKHFWKFIGKYKRDQRKVKKIWSYIEKWYNQKNDSFKLECSFEDYEDHFCEVMAEVHEEASNDAAHVLERIPMKPDHEFKLIRVYGDDDLDEHVTILINAIGLTFLSDEDPDKLLLTNSIIQKKTK